MQEIHPTRLTKSSLGTWNECARQYYYRYVLRLRPVKVPGYFQTGRAFHAALEYYGEGADEQEAIHAALQDFGEPAEVDLTDEQLRDYHVDRAVLSGMLAGWFWRWEEWNQQIEWLETECEFDQPIINPATGRKSRTYTLAGVLDAVIRLDDGRIALAEYKTTGQKIDTKRDGEDADYWQHLRIDPQVTLYWPVARELFGVETVMYDVCRKPGIKPKSVPRTDEQGRKVVYNEDGTRAYKDNGELYLSANRKKGRYYDKRTETPEEYQDRFLGDISERPDYYYQRREIPRIQADIEEAQAGLWDTTKILRRCELTGRWPRNPWSCARFGRCAYWDLCLGDFDPADDVVPDGFEVVDYAHTELKGEA